ncbi:MAG: DUF2294 domain-containing protein [Planctomycetota bacterium]
MKSRGEIETEISQAIIQFEKEYMGRGPIETKTYIMDDLVLVRLKGVLSKADYKLLEMEAHHGGRELIKQTRQNLLEHGRPLLEAVLWDILGIHVKSLHTDVSTRTGERIIVFTLEHKFADTDS